MASAAYAALQTHITLIRGILPAASALGTYSQLEQAQIRAFRLLAHAELEYYFETRCLEVVTAFKNGLNPTSSPLIRSRLSQFFYINRREDYSPWVFDQSKVCASYERVIAKNHGIKEKNVFALFWPIGLDDSKFPTTLLPSLDSYGTDRGAIAHNGLSHTITFILDPSNEITEIGFLLTDLLILDVEIDKLLV